MIDIPAHDELSLEGLASPYLEEIELYGLNISTLNGVENCPSLKILKCCARNLGEGLSDISAVASLSRLEILQCDRNQITDISPIKDLPNLWLVSMEENQITDISALKGNSSITDLYLVRNPLDITNVMEVLFSMTALEFYFDNIPAPPQDAQPDEALTDAQYSRPRQKYSYSYRDVYENNRNYPN